ncbi:polyamine deacetylase HDAC10 isoform X2 [Protopterus annectens]|nr:polyamine deacetylase HDAC10 isoform X2 [Protopterus annectens]
MTLEELKQFSKTYGDMYFHQNSYHCALLAAGATLQLVDSVVTGRVQNGMALVRPPGHHSQRSEASGFCVFNNVAIAAEYAKQKCGFQRILIVDWDIHHGQGTQFIFEDDPRVLYFSWHRYEHQEFWPNLKESDYDAVGKEKGAGFNVNLPWNKVGMQNADYLAVFFHVLLPIAFEFNPELVIVSAGFDSGIGDPEGEMCAMPECFAHLTNLLMCLANGKLCVVFEGGYNLKTLRESVCMTVLTLLGDPIPKITGEMVACLSAIESVQNVKSVHQKYWNCFKYQELLPVQEPSTNKQKVEKDRNSDESGTAGNENTNPSDTPLKECDPFSDSYITRILPKVPSVRTGAVISGDECTLQDKTVQTEEKSLTKDDMAAFISISDYRCLEDEQTLISIGRMCCLTQKIVKKQVRNGFAVLPKNTSASSLAVAYSIASGINRVLYVVVGEMDVPNAVTDDGTILLLQFSDSHMPDKANAKYGISFGWKKPIRYNSEFLYVLFEIILPLAYEYCPELVIIDLGSKCDSTVGFLLIHLLQGLAEGRTLVIVQDSEMNLVDMVANTLLGKTTPLPEICIPASWENISDLERQRQELQKDWKMVQYSVC